MLTSGKVWCVYALREPGEPYTFRYIGCTSDAKNRLHTHISFARTSRGSGSVEIKKNEWIKSLLDRNEEPFFQVLYILSSCTLARRIEAKLQEKYYKTIFNPRIVPTAGDGDKEYLLAIIEHLTQELYDEGKAWRRAAKKHPKLYDDFRTYAVLAMREAEVVRRDIGMMPINPRERRRWIEELNK